MLLQDDDGFRYVKKLTKSICENINKELKVQLIIDYALLQECFYAARNSLKFYNSDENADYSLYKEVGHLVYWSRKLKPVRIESPRNFFEATKIYAKNIAQEVFGDPLVFEKNLSKYEEEHKLRLSFPVNERFALYLGMILITVCQTSYVKNKMPGVLEDYKKQVAEAKALISEKFTDDITMSFRFHTHSARSTALFMEGLLKTKYI